MDELDRRGALSDRRGDPLDRPVAHVARSEDAREAGLQPERRALERPAGWRLAGTEQVTAGHDVAAVVTLDDAVQPPGVRLGADQHEQRRRGHRLGGAVLPVDQRDAFQPPPPVPVDHLGAQADRDVRGRLDLLDQVVRHAGAQGVLQSQDGHRGGVPGQVDGRLAGGVPGADHEHVLALHRPCLGSSSAVEHARPVQRLQAGHAEAPPCHAGGEDRRTRRDLGPPGQPQQPVGPARPERGRGLGEDEVRSEQPGLLEGPVGEVVTADPSGKAEVVPDPGAGPGLPAEHLRLDDQRAEPLGRGVDGGCQAGRASADDDQVADPHRRLGRAAEQLHQLGVGRLDEQDPLGARVQFAGASQEVHPRHLGQLMVRDQQRDLLRTRRQPRPGRRRPGRRSVSPCHPQIRSPAGTPRRVRALSVVSLDLLAMSCLHCQGSLTMAVVDRGVLRPGPWTAGRTRVTCANCGEVNPSHARFCLNCGAPLEAGRAWQGVRKVVTVIFCDVTGSTALGERLDTESLSRVMASYFDAMRAVIDRHHGVVQKFVGDAVVAVFGVPIVREDDALWAVRAAAAMQEALAGLNDDLARDWGVGLRIRIGVSTGEVMVGDPRLGDALVIGDTVNLATRLEAAARPGEVLLDQRTWHLARDAVVVAPLQDDRLTASGITGPTFRLVDVAPDVLGHARRQDSPLVGREDELQLFDWIRRRSARESTCHLLTVLGAAGVGKSRLVDDAIAVAGEQVTALVGRCLPDAAGSTFWPLAEVVRRAAEVKSADSPDEAQAKLTELLAVAADGPRIADRVGRLIGLEAAPAPAEETGWAVRRFFEVLAARKPLVVVLDDLHLAEPTLLDLIEQVAALARQAPILLVAVARLDLLEQRRHWGGGMPNASTLMLEPLDPNESATLLGHLAGQGTLPPEVRTHIAQTAEGNPLFLEEIVGMLIEEGHLRRQCGGWVVSYLSTWTLTTPPTIHAIVAAPLL